MSWKRPEEAATHYAVSPRTIRARVASGELPSYLEGEEPATRRWVWCRRSRDVAEVVAELVTAHAALVAEVERLRDELHRERPADEAPRPCPAPETRRAASPVVRRTKAATTHSTPPASATSGEAAELVERLIAAHGGRVDRAAAALGVGRVTVSRWRGGKRAPSPESVALIVAALAEVEPEAQAA